MNDGYIQGLIARRIGGENFGKGEPLYKFERIKRAKRAAAAANPGVAIIDLGVGEPDEGAAPGVLQALALAAANPVNRGYADNGIDEYKLAASQYLERVFGASGLDPQHEINHAIGSKPALAMLPQAFINPGDVTLLTVPGYPIIGTMTRWLGGETFLLPLLPENGFLPELDDIPADILKKAKLLYLNYPNNPTGASATREFFTRVVDFARRHSILVVHDAAYAALTFDGNKPLSFLSVPGAKEVGIEIHSMSKAFNMTGWRLAFVAGNELAVRAFASVKDNNDSGQFRAIQHAGAYALGHPELTETAAAKYSRRHDMLAEVLGSLGFSVKKPAASFYMYAKIPVGAGSHRFNSSTDFCDFLIEKALVSAVPWDDAGHFLRYSVTYEAADEDTERAVMAELHKRLARLELRFDE